MYRRSYILLIKSYTNVKRSYEGFTKKIIATTFQGEDVYINSLFCEKELGRFAVLSIIYFTLQQLYPIIAGLLSNNQPEGT